MLLLIIGIPMFLVYAQPPDSLLLQNTTITTTVIFEARYTITAGPNFAIAETGDATFVTDGHIYFRPRVVIVRGGRFQVVVRGPADVQTTEAAMPAKFSLQQNFPNPFNPATTLAFDLPHRSSVTLHIFTALGQLIVTLVNEEKDAGRYSVVWDGRNAYGVHVGSGVYFYRLRAGDFVETKKLILLR